MCRVKNLGASWWAAGGIPGVDAESRKAGDQVSPSFDRLWRAGFGVGMINLIFPHAAGELVSRKARFSRRYLSIEECTKEQKQMITRSR